MELKNWMNDDDDNDSGDDRSKLCTEYHIHVHACKDYTTWNTNKYETNVNVSTFTDHRQEWAEDGVNL
jgi:hypothetical protein